jgi:hypothetical protein
LKAAYAARSGREVHRTNQLGVLRASIGLRWSTTRKCVQG